MLIFQPVNLNGWHTHNNTNNYDHRRLFSKSHRVCELYLIWAIDFFDFHVFHFIRNTPNMWPDNIFINNVEHPSYWFEAERVFTPDFVNGTRKHHKIHVDGAERFFLSGFRVWVRFPDYRVTAALIRRRFLKCFRRTAIVNDKSNAHKVSGNITDAC